MKRLYITDSSEQWTEKFIDDRFEIISRSGLNLSEKHVIEQLVFLKEPKRLLFAENRTGAAAMIAHEMYPDAEIYVHSIDKYYSEKMWNNLKSNGIREIKVMCTPDFPKEKFDAVFLQCSKTNIMKELFMEWIDEAYMYLKKKGKLVVGMETRFKWLEDHIKLHFGSMTFNDYKRNGVSLISRKSDMKEIPLTNRDYFDCEVEEDIAIPYSSRAGVFAHHRIDDGAYALIKTVDVKPGQTLFDMGAGIGSVGIALGCKEPLEKITFCDSNARAIDSCKHNCDINNLENVEFILAADGAREKKDEYDVVVANPPYFSNYKIAELFVKTGLRVLKKGGEAWFVAKNIDILKTIMMENFGNAKVIRKFGYNVIYSMKK